MAASKSQGSYFGLFLVGSTVLCGGIALFASAAGKLLVLVGETPVLPSPEAMKWVGAGVALLGWVVTIGGLHFVNTSGGRIVVSLLGIAVSFFGMLYVLPAAFNKTAFWKTAGGKPARNGFTAVASTATLESELTGRPRAMESAR